MATIITHGANTWRVEHEGEAYLVSRTRGVDSNDQPRGWVWKVRIWRGTARGPRGFQRQHWHTLPAYGPRADSVAKIVNRMLQEVRA
jgi:hypothetical protein